MDHLAALCAVGNVVVGLLSLPLPLPIFSIQGQTETTTGCFVVLLVVIVVIMECVWGAPWRIIPIPTSIKNFKEISWALMMIITLCDMIPGYRLEH